MLVGLWPAIHEDPAAKQIERGPQTSGVFARMAPDGRSLALLDGAGPRRAHARARHRARRRDELRARARPSGS